MLILTMSNYVGPVHLTDKDTGQKIEIEVLAVKGQSVRVGFTAPDNIEILRDNLYWRQKND